MTPLETAAAAASTAGSGLALGPSWMHAETLLHDLGPYVVLGLCLIVFAECGLLIGFFMPGDSLLFTAGLFVSNDYIDTPLWLLCALLTACAIIGNAVGYYIGLKLGPTVFSKPDSRLFRREYVDKTAEFFERYGAQAIVLARFVPIVRTFITVMAGVARMHAGRYLTYSVIGGIVWASGVTLLGYWLGQYAFIRDNVETILILVVLVSVVPVTIELLRNRRAKRAVSGQDAAQQPLSGRPTAGE